MNTQFDIDDATPHHPQGESGMSPLPFSIETCFQMLIDNIADIFWIFDAKSQTGIYISQAFESVFGRPIKDFYSDYLVILKMVHPEDQDTYKQMLSLMLNGKETDSYYRIINVQGNTVWLRSRSTPIIDTNGEHIFTVGICRDVTTRKATEIALRDSREHYRKAAESNRQLLQEVNHRVRNNLAGLMSLIKLTRRTSQTLDEYNDMIMRRINLMTFVHDILAHAGWEDVDFKSVLEHIASQAETFHNNPVSMIIKGDSIFIHPRQIMPLMLALLELFNISEYVKTNPKTINPFHITWKQTQLNNMPALHIQWTQHIEQCDLPQAPPELMEKITLAKELVNGFIGYELGGAAHINTQSNDFHHEITIPLQTMPDTDLAATTSV
ncbi:PAS domain-containing protein [Poriferisphaera sp. WC338]|uniref:PAS domain-containing protein n=1 Tax=Poriferisphaera sp. WC338 TaxID=3425129 RepID=UPI003D815191